ncbi:MAG: NADH-quinone oxidoreductase subunit L, partial [Burkholderiales bacterium]
FHGVIGMMTHALGTLPFWLAVGGAATAWFIYIVRPDLPAVLRRKWGVVVTILMEKYGFDRFNDWFFAGGARALGTGLWKGGDVAVIDNVMVNGSARLVGWVAAVVRHVQSGYIYHYAFAMIVGILLLLTLAYGG